MALWARGLSKRSSCTPSSSGDMPGSIDEELCVQPPSTSTRSPEILATGFGRATSAASSTASSGREQTNPAALPSATLAPRALPTLDDEPELTASGSVSETRKVWQTCTSTVLKAAGRKSGSDSGNMVNQLATLMGALQEHFDKKLESAVHDIKQSLESSHHSTAVGSPGGWQRGDSESSKRTEEDWPRKRQSGRERMDDERDKSETSQLPLGSSSQTRDLQLPDDVMSHIQSSGYSMEEIQKAQEKHLLGVLREKRSRMRGQRPSGGSHATHDGNFTSALPHIGGEGDGSTSSLQCPASSPQLSDIIESHSIEEENLPTIRPLSMLLLRIWGLFPWSQSSPRRRVLSFFYQTLVLLLALCATLLQIKDTVGRLEIEPSWKVESVGYLIVSISASLGLIQVQRLAKISEIAGVLATEGSEKRLLWGFLSYNDVGAVLNLMVFALIVITTLFQPDDLAGLDFEALVRVLFLKGLLCSVNFFVFLVAHAMQLTAEGFCRDFIRRPHFGAGIEFWGSIHAMLHKLCNDLAAVLLTLVLTALGIIATLIFEPPVEGAKLEVLYRTVPFLILPVYVLTTMSQAADVTETCMRVPPLINSLNFGVELDVERLYLVQYIVHSGAGFYFNKMRLTGSMVTKAAYVMGLLMLSFVTGARLDA